MKKIITFIFTLILFLSIFTYSQEYSGKSLEDAIDKSIISNEYFNIPKKDIVELEKEALYGSPEAALKLYLYNDFYLSDFNEGLYWCQIAAENGDSSSMYNYAFSLVNDCKEFEWDSLRVKRANQRAYFWFKKAEENGIDASYWLDKLESESQ